MPDTTKTVTTVDIQMLDENREGTTTVKLDNPRDNLTREQVSAAMQTPFANGWFLCGNGKTAKYLGDVIINQSIKTTLDGADFYVTPDTLELVVPSTAQIATWGENAIITCSGAIIMGYNIRNYASFYTSKVATLEVQIRDNGLSVKVRGTLKDQNTFARQKLFDLDLVIQGTVVTVPVYLTVEQKA